MYVCLFCGCEQARGRKNSAAGERSTAARALSFIESQNSHIYTRPTSKRGPRALLLHGRAANSTLQERQRVANPPTTPDLHLSTTYCIDGSYPFILTHCHHLIDGTVMVDFLRARGDEETRGGCCGARGGCCGVQIHTMTSSFDSERRTTRRRAHSLQIPRSTGKPDKTEEQRWRDPHNGYVDLISGV